MDDLDHLLAQRAAANLAKPMPVPDALMARILADAAHAQPRPLVFGYAQGRTRTPAKSLTIWQTLADMFGGGGVLAGLATVACAGLYLGAVQPVAINTVALAFAGSSAVDQLDFMPSIDALLAEE